MRAWAHVLFWCSEEYESLRLGRVLLQSCLKVSNTMVFLPFTLDAVTNKTCFTQDTERNRVCLQVWSKPTNNHNNNNNNSAFKKGKMFISFPRFSVFSQRDKFPVVQTNHHVTVCHFYDVLIVCEFRLRIKDTVKMFLLLFVLFESFKSGLRAYKVWYLIPDPSTGPQQKVPRCKLSEQRCTSFPHNLPRRSLYFLKCSWINKTINWLSITSILFQDFRIQIQNLFSCCFFCTTDFPLHIVYVLHLLTVLILVALPEDDSQPTVMLICSVTQLMGVSTPHPPPKDPAAVVIAVERQRHQTKQTISRNGVFAELKECSVYPAEIQEVDGNLAAWVCEEALWNHGRLL